MPATLTAASPRSTRSHTTRSREHASASAIVRGLLVDTAFGCAALAYSPEALLRLAWGHESPQGAWRAITDDMARDSRGPIEVELEQKDSAAPRWVRSLTARLADYAVGKEIDFADVPVDVAHLTPFQLAVHFACRRIARGEVGIGGDLAALAGAPRGARAVGNVMRSNRTPIVVPCHRVVGAGGRLGGYSAPTGLTMKRRLLALEGAPLGR